MAGFDILANLEPCFEVGGDLYDAQLMSDGRYAFLIGDVVGKGLGAALLVSHILSWTRFMITEGWDPEPLITRLNSQIFSCTDHVRFATFFLGYLEPDTGRDISEIMHEHSARADVVFLGLMIPAFGDEIRYAERLEELAGGLKTTIFVRNAGRFAGDLL